MLVKVLKNYIMILLCKIKSFKINFQKIEKQVLSCV